MEPLVSIITPTYNHKQYLEKCIKSVLNQTFTNWELIIIDDHSDDNTYNIALSFAKTDKRIKIIKHKSRWGLKRLKDTYNQALALSKGNLIAILEGDDYWPKNKLEMQIKPFNNDKIILSFGDCILVNKDNIPLDVQTYHKNRNFLNNSPTGSILYLYRDIDFYIAPVTAIIRKSAILKIKGFKNDNIYPFIDIPTFLNLSLKGNFFYVNRVLGYYRKHEASSWFNYAKKTQSMGRLELVSYLKTFVNKNKEILKTNNITLFNKSVIEKQKKIINKRRDEKQLSVIKHELAFGNYNYAKELSKKLLRERKLPINNKIVTLFISSNLVNRTYLLKTVGYLKLFLYSVKIYT